jgi:hypothetical protein
VYLCIDLKKGYKVWSQVNWLHTIIATKTRKKIIFICTENFSILSI